MVLYTTLRLLRRYEACERGYTLLCSSLPKRYIDDAPISFRHIVESNGLDDALWALRAVPDEQHVLRDKLARLFECDCAAHVLPLYEAEHSYDDRPRKAIETSRRYANGQVTTEELSAAWAAARDAAWDAARAARAAARDAARDAARAARDAAWNAAWDAAWFAARDAARDAARHAGWTNEQNYQTTLLLGRIERPQ